MIISDFVLHEREGVSFFVSKSLEEAGFKHGFSTRRGGVSPLPDSALSLGNVKQDERANVIENRRRFLRSLDAENWTLVTARQIHSADAHRVLEANNSIAGPVTCDALVANRPRSLLAVQTADCLAILLADERTGAFAAVHAGWRGTLGSIVAHTIELMQRTEGTRPVDLRAALGPAIGSCCFEVGVEVAELFGSRFAYAAEHMTWHEEKGKSHLDLTGLNKHQLLECGLTSDRIVDTGLCTLCRNDLFFSYRRERGAEQPVGRLMGVIGRAI